MKNTSEKKGQITLFFAIGAVLLVTILILLFAAQSTNNRTDTNTKTTLEAEQYLASCMENEFYTWLDELATNEDKWIELPSITSPEQLGITQSLNDLYGPIAQSYSNLIQSSSFGTITAPAFCDTQGPNGLTVADAPLRCSTFSYGENSLQEQAENRIANAMKSCASRGIDDDVGISLSSWEKPDVTLTLGKQAVIIKATYPQTTIQKQYPVRLLSLFSFTNERLLMTTKDPRIKITDLTHAMRSAYYQEGFLLGHQTIASDTSPGEILHRYTIIDTYSTYRGSQLTIAFMTDDRPAYEDAFAQETYDPDG